MSNVTLFRWQDDALSLIDYCDPSPYRIEAADSWLVSEGTAFALRLHEERFEGAVASLQRPDVEVKPFWKAIVRAIPDHGEWFPRVELRSHEDESTLVFRLRSAPELTRSLTVITHRGSDPRTTPAMKGPDLEAMTRIRSQAQELGADEPILTPQGYIVEGATTSLAWWRGNVLCTPPHSFERIASVTERSLLSLAHAMKVATVEEAVTPAELEGTEVWALNALHGIRIVTHWIDGPSLAEAPGRLALWRKQYLALRKPVRGVGI